jgi:hypothetical protein
MMDRRRPPVHSFSAQRSKQMARNTFEKMARDLEKNASKGDDTVDTNVQDEEITVETVKVEKPKPFCECGCGGQTGGGRFIPGHDAKLKSRLFKIVREQMDGDVEAAIAELKDRNWYYLLTLPAQPSTHNPKKAANGKPQAAVVSKLTRRKDGSVVIEFENGTTATLEVGKEALVVA